MKQEAFYKSLGLGDKGLNLGCSYAVASGELGTKREGFQMTEVSAEF